MKDIVKNWIVGISGSELDNVITYRVSGTKKAVRRHLLSLVRQDRKNDENEGDYWDSGTEKVSEITENEGGVLYACGMYSFYHMDYTATPEKEPVNL